MATRMMQGPPCSPVPFTPLVQRARGDNDKITTTTTTFVIIDNNNNCNNNNRRRDRRGSEGLEHGRLEVLSRVVRCCQTRLRRRHSRGRAGAISGRSRADLGRILTPSRAPILGAARGALPLGEYLGEYLGECLARRCSPGRRATRFALSGHPATTLAGAVWCRHQQSTSTSHQARDIRRDIRRDIHRDGVGAAPRRVIRHEIFAEDSANILTNTSQDSASSTT